MTQASAEEAPTLLAPDQENAIGVTLGLLGDEWTLLIVRYAIEGARRYGDWLAELPISNSVLAGRLGVLVGAGVLERQEYQERPVRAEYRLTRRGRELWTVLLSIWAWEAAWVEEHRTTLPRMRHTACRRFFAPVLTCASCQTPVEARDVEGEFGPSGSWERSVPRASTRRRSGAAPGRQPGLFPETMALVGNRWSSALLGAAFQGAHRFRDFQTRLAAPPSVVADRLRTFCELGVMDVSPVVERADWAEYRLTEKGRAFYPVVALGLDWGQRWFVLEDGPALVFRHRGCRRPFVPRLACSACRETLRGEEVRAVPRSASRAGAVPG